MRLRRARLRASVAFPPEQLSASCASSIRLASCQWAQKAPISSRPSKFAACSAPFRRRSRVVDRLASKIRSAVAETQQLLSDTPEELRVTLAPIVLEHLLGDLAPNRPNERSQSDLRVTVGADDFATLYHACEPGDESERALVGAYWIQEHEGKNPFESQAVNDALK